MQITYMGWVPDEDDPKKHILKAVEYYKKKFGIEPTLIVVKPSAPPEYDECSYLVRSRYGMAYGMLLTHLVMPNELSLPDKVSQKVREESLPVQDQDIRAHAPNRFNISEKEKGRPVKGAGMCPHCGEAIKNFDKLGWWWGWEQGIEPPYWEELRHWVFSRDHHTCQNCYKIFANINLVAHHIEPKEDGGADSSRNLRTLCNECHLDDKPIFPEEQD